MQELYFEDFQVGGRFETAGITLTESQIIDYALVHDPQPFHVDKVAAGRSVFGGLIASGFQTMALTFRLFYETGVLRAANLGGAGIHELRWLRPVRPGDTLSAAVEVLEMRPSGSREDRGWIRFGYTARNQDAEPVLTMAIDHLVARRAPAAISV
ncbi:MaoC family dehydratase [Arenibaculum pallidiluteum]|uniref:MaoC family dehydratase n=1 Tax=Arenibaculum pallidiluteum TaxID=2812559 RepID=UPI001A965070